MTEARYDNANLGEFLHLQDEKSFSRLLYTNPVCLLTTVNSTRTSTSATSSIASAPRRNVMVISWLTPTNNTGKFVMSVNKRRHTASILVPTPPNDDNHNAEFVLCVPVAGMEDLIRNVGKTSGRWGSSKFPSDQIHAQSEKSGLHHDTLTASTASGSSNTHGSTPPFKKKKKKFENGIDGLIAVKIGTTDEEPAIESKELFGIMGTVAHIKCRVNGIVEETNTTDPGGNGLDEDHHLILAEVTNAYIKKDYWDETKKQFRPIGQKCGDDEAQVHPPPYLTFFGSQTFGYVVNADMLNK